MTYTSEEAGREAAETATAPNQQPTEEVYVAPSEVTRNPLSTRTRFEIFKRDDFTCQYCGRQAPAVILHADHIVPVADGGTDDPMNLITACEDCNHGKSAVS